MTSQQFLQAQQLKDQYSSSDLFHQSMIIDKTISYTFEQPFFKVFEFFPAFDDSIVFIAQMLSGKDLLVHFSKENKQLYRLEFHELVQCIVPINDKQFVILREEFDQLWYINIEKQQVAKFKHKFKQNIGSQTFLEYFCETRLLCVREHGDYADQSISLTYYSFPLTSTGIYQHSHDEDQEQQQFIQQVKRKIPQKINLIKPFAAMNGITSWNPARVVRKVNPRSRYVWGDSKQKDKIVMNFAEVTGNQVVVGNHRINICSLYQPYNLPSMEIAIIQLWQLRKDEFIMYTATTKSDKNAVNPNTNVINNTFVWDLGKKTIRQSNFAFDPKYHNNQIDIVGTPYFSMFRTFHFQPGTVKSSPAYFVINEEQRVIKQESWKCSHVQKYVVPDNAIDTIIEGSFENQNVQKIGLRTIKIVFRPEMSLFLLLNMHGKQERINDWNIDLLADIIDALDYQ